MITNESHLGVPVKKLAHQPGQTAKLTYNTCSRETIMCNVTEDQVNEAVEVVFDTLQLPPRLADDFYMLLVNWLDMKNVEVIE
jgi:hypothetical protein